MYSKRNDHSLGTELICSLCLNSVRQVVRRNVYGLARDPGASAIDLLGSVFHLAPLAAAPSTPAAHAVAVEPCTDAARTRASRVSFGDGPVRALALQAQSQDWSHHARGARSMAAECGAGLEGKPRDRPCQIGLHRQWNGEAGSGISSQRGRQIRQTAARSRQLQMTTPGNHFATFDCQIHRSTIIDIVTFCKSWQMLCLTRRSIRFGSPHTGRQQI